MDEKRTGQTPAERSHLPLPQQGFPGLSPMLIAGQTSEVSLNNSEVGYQKPKAQGMGTGEPAEVLITQELPICRLISRSKLIGM